MGIAIEVAIILAIVGLQIWLFFKNIKVMDAFRKIFFFSDSWRVIRESTPSTLFQSETSNIVGIDGEGNDPFLRIIRSINRYIKANKGGVVDFDLLKDAVDRNCDSLEEDVDTLTPVPLYCGLVGTILGVIIGLIHLIPDISQLGASDAQFTGVHDLLVAVAIAMVASAAGIIFTTISSLRFKHIKVKQQLEKNEFFSWLQTDLLPKVAGDTSSALVHLVDNLNTFNTTFAENTSQLGSRLGEVNALYDSQAKIIESVQKMDMQAVAYTNVATLKELKECSDLFSNLQNYLFKVTEFTDSVQTLTQELQNSADYHSILKDLKSFFENYKGVLAQQITDCDVNFTEAVRGLKAHVEEAGEEIKKAYNDCSVKLNAEMAEQKDKVLKMAEDMHAKFLAQLAELPNLIESIEKIANLSTQLPLLTQRVEDANASLADRIERSNTEMADRVVQAINEQQSGYVEVLTRQSTSPEAVGASRPAFPRWMSWVIFSCVVGMFALIATPWVMDLINWITVGS